MLAPMSAGEFRLDFFVPLPPRCPYKSPALQNAHITRAHTKNNKTIFFAVLVMRGVGALGALMRTAPNGLPTPLQVTLRQNPRAGTLAPTQLLSEISARRNRHPFTTVVILVQEGSKKSPPSHRRLKDPSLWARSSRGSFFFTLALQLNMLLLWILFL